MESPILRYIIKRFINFIIVAFGAITINFALPRLMPGDPLAAMLMEMETLSEGVEGGKEIIEYYVKEFGLDKDIFTQYVCYLKQLLSGDLGPSIMAYPTPVQDLLAKVIPWSIGLLLTTTILSWIIGNVLGVFVGWSKKRRLNGIITVVSLGFSVIPYYILALILVFLFAYEIRIFPTGGGYAININPSLTLEFIASVLYHSLLPALSILLVAVGGWLISMRSLIVSILGEDYLLFAEAKGLKKNVIMMRYAFRNALLPQVTGLALSLGGIVSGALLTEQIFAYPGVGTLFFDAFRYRDYNVMQAVLLFATLGTLGAAFIIDILYPLIDPRICYEEG